MEAHSGESDPGVVDGIRFNVAEADKFAACAVSKIKSHSAVRQEIAMIKAPLATAPTVASILLVQPAFAQSRPKLSKIAFDASCNRRRKSNPKSSNAVSALVLAGLISKGFEDVLKASPRCGIAPWGIVPSFLRHTRVRIG
jgi:hypothetical protein